MFTKRERERWPTLSSCLRKPFFVVTLFDEFVDRIPEIINYTLCFELQHNMPFIDVCVVDITEDIRLCHFTASFGSDTNTIKYIRVGRMLGSLEHTTTYCRTKRFALKTPRIATSFHWASPISMTFACTTMLLRSRFCTTWTLHLISLPVLSRKVCCALPLRLLHGGALSSS